MHRDRRKWFRIERETDGTPVAITHLDSESIGSDVQIGANVCIDRGVFIETVVEAHVKIDNLVYIGHNSRVRRQAFIMSTAVLGVV